MESGDETDENPISIDECVQHARQIQNHHQIMKRIQRKKVTMKITVRWPRILPKMEIEKNTD